MKNRWGQKKEREEEERNRESCTKGSLLSTCICGGTFPLSSYYEKSLVLSMPYIIFISPKVSAIRAQIYSHRLDRIQLRHQDIQFRDNISNPPYIQYNIMWIAGRSFARSNLMWSEWDITVSNSVQATSLNPRSVHARHPKNPKNLWTVMVSEQPPGCFRQCTELSAGNTSQTEERTFSRAAHFLQRMSACLCLIGVN